MSQSYKVMSYIWAPLQSLYITHHTAGQCAVSLNNIHYVWVYYSYTDNTVGWALRLPHGADEDPSLLECYTVSNGK